MAQFRDMYVSPEFRTLDGLEERTHRLRTAKLEAVMVGTKILDGKRGVVDADTGQYIDIVSDDYVITQNALVFKPVIQALRESGLEYLEGAIVEPLGKMFATIRIPAWDAEVANERIASQIVVHNSYDRSASYGAWLMFRRLVCNNGMVCMVDGAVWNATHLHDMSTVADDFQSFLDAVKDAPYRIEPSISRAKETKLDQKQLYPMLRGAGIGQRMANSIIGDMVALYPEVLTEGLTKWAVYNMSTNFISSKSGDRPQTRVGQLKEANNILEIDLGELVKRGEATIASEA